MERRSERIEAPCDPAGKDRSVMTDEELVRKVEEWTDCLGLQDWTITVLRRVHIDGDDCGLVEYVESTKSAVISLLMSDAYDEGEYSEPYDMERTLVHELLHCKFALLYSDDEKDLQSRIVHQLIDDMARALVQAKRSGPCPGSEAVGEAELPDAAQSFHRPRYSRAGRRAEGKAAAQKAEALGGR